LKYIRQRIELVTNNPPSCNKIAPGETMQTLLKKWQKMRCFYIKGRIISTMNRIKKLDTDQGDWLIFREKQQLKRVYFYLLEILENYDRNTQKLKPRKE
jgi:hypothetical protein